jgi:hypothetical protein
LGLECNCGYLHRNLQLLILGFLGSTFAMNRLDLYPILAYNVARVYAMFAYLVHEASLFGFVIGYSLCYKDTITVYFYLHLCNDINV